MIQEEKNFFERIEERLKMSQDSLVSRKALPILESILSAKSSIPNFTTLFGTSSSSCALYVLGATYKLILRYFSSQKHDDKFNMEGYLMLINLCLSDVNAKTLKDRGLIKEMREKMIQLLKNYKEKSQIMIRYIFSILSFTFMAQIGEINFGKDKKNRQFVLYLFYLSVESHRSNILSKQSSKLLVLLARNNNTIAQVVEAEIKAGLLNVQIYQTISNSNLYLWNIKELILELKVSVINDVAVRLLVHLCSSQMNEPSSIQYLTQCYFFMSMISGKLIPETLSELLLILITNVPQCTEGDQKIGYCYLQLLYDVVFHLGSAANKNMGGVIGVFLEFRGKIEKFSTNLLCNLIENCFQQSLWLGKQTNSNNQLLDLLNIKNMHLDQEIDTEEHSFGKVLSMFESLISERYSSSTSSILLSQFFKKMSHQTLSECLPLIHKVISNQSMYNQRQFHSILHSLYNCYGFTTIIELYSVSLKGEISNSNFVKENNLWVIEALQKYDGEQSIAGFRNYILPLLEQVRKRVNTFSHVKPLADAYMSVEKMIWRGMKPFCRKIDVKANYEQIIMILYMAIKQCCQITTQTIATVLEILSVNLAQAQYKSTQAEKIIKQLAGSLDLSKHYSQQILKTIKALSLISKKEYIMKVFDKNIEKLITLAEKNTFFEEEEKNLKNMEILMAVTRGINMRDPSVATSYRLSRQELVIKLISSLIKEKNVLQKKAYKYMSEVLEIAPKSFTLEIIDLIQEHNSTTLASSKHYRLSILLKIWKNLMNFSKDLTDDQGEGDMQKIFNFIKAYLPEILLALRENNKRTRHEAGSLLDSFLTKINQLNLLENFIEIMCAGFASESSQVKLATISGLQVALKKGDKDNNINVCFEEVVEIVMILLKQKKQELYKGVLLFLKIYIARLSKSKQSQLLPEIIKLLFIEDEESKLLHRSLLKHFLLKLVKKFGKQHVDKLIPVDDRKFLGNAVKVEKREKKKKREISKLKRQSYKLNQLKNKNKNKGDENLSEEEQIQSQHQLQIIESENEMIQEQQEGKNDKNQKNISNPNNLLMKYDLQKENFHFEDDMKYKKLGPKQNKRVEGIDGITFNEQGMMVVSQDSRVRKRIDEQQQQKDFVNEQYQNTKKRKKTDTVHQIKQSGVSFKSNRAGGDVRHKDKPQPYAFIQLNSKALNKRFKKRAEKVFDSIFEKKEGGLKGVKSRMLNK